MSDCIAAAAAVGLRIAQREPALGAQLLDELARELAALVEGVGLGRHLGVDEARDAAPELVLLGGERDHVFLRRARRAAVAASLTSSPTITTPYSSRAASTETYSSSTSSSTRAGSRSNGSP